MNFKYSISDDKLISDAEEGFCSTREPSKDEIILVKRDQKNGAVMVMANECGWQYLAKICIEMAYTFSKDPGFHIHRTAEFEIGDNSLKEEIGFFHIGEELEQQLAQKRVKK